MLRRSLRAALATSLLLVLWAIARPAHAMPAAAAGFCDDRGASAVAPPPALEPPDEAIARARSRACDAAAGLPLHATIDAGWRTPVPPSDGPDAVPPAAPASISTAPGEALDAPSEAARPPDGVRPRIERPPRG